MPKCSEGLRKSSKKLEKLFSSFLRGASCPKSPRVAATAAKSFMPESLADVKSSVFGLGTQHAASLQQTTRTLVLYEQLGHGLGLRADEVCGEILSQQGITFRAGDGFLGVVAVFGLRA